MGKILKILCSVLILLSFISIVQATVETGWTGPNVPRNPTDGHIDFEEGVDSTPIISQISGIQFTGSEGFNWIYLDHRTLKYNYPTYYWIGNFAAYCGATQNWGRIDFTGGKATYFSVLVATYSGVTVDAYDVAGNLIATSEWAANNLDTFSMTRLTVETADGSPTIAYVIVHDTGNYWAIDEICTDAPGIPSQTNQAPVAEAGGPYSGLAGQVIEFDASGSSDPDGNIVKQEWDWNNDGIYDLSSTGITDKLTQSFLSSGTYTVGLRVQDDDGATATDTATVIVKVVPVANAGPDITVLRCEAVSFDGSGSYDPDGVIDTYTWAFGDGTTGTGQTTTHTYSTAGTYTATLKGTVPDVMTTTDTVTVTVLNPSQGIGDLKLVLKGMHINLAKERILTSYLDTAQKMTGMGMCPQAVTSLQSFNMNVKGMTGLYLTPAQANTLTAYSNRIITSIQKCGCR